MATNTQPTGAWLAAMMMPMAVVVGCGGQTDAPPPSPTADASANMDAPASSDVPTKPRKDGAGGESSTPAPTVANGAGEGSANPSAPGDSPTSGPDATPTKPPKDPAQPTPPPATAGERVDGTGTAAANGETVSPTNPAPTAAPDPGAAPQDPPSPAPFPVPNGKYSDAAFIEQFPFPDSVKIEGKGYFGVGDVVEIAGHKLIVERLDFENTEVVLQVMATRLRVTITTRTRYFRTLLPEDRPIEPPTQPGPEAGAEPPPSNPNSRYSNLFFIEQFPFDDTFKIEGHGYVSKGSRVVKDGKSYAVIEMNFAAQTAVLENLKSGEHITITTRTKYSRSE